jgi:hypothetical protein
MHEFGAKDYVSKYRLFRLAPVVKRAGEKAEEHRKRKQAEEGKKKLEAQNSAKPKKWRPLAPLQEA